LSNDCYPTHSDEYGDKDSGYPFDQLPGRLDRRVRFWVISGEEVAWILPQFLFYSKILKNPCNLLLATKRIGYIYSSLAGLYISAMFEAESVMFDQGFQTITAFSQRAIVWMMQGLKHKMHKFGFEIC